VGLFFRANFQQSEFLNAYVSMCGCVSAAAAADVQPAIGQGGQGWFPVIHIDVCLCLSVCVLAEAAGDLQRAPGRGGQG
jgi:hypothetical protein